MHLLDSENRLQIWTPAKLNFHLEILGKRPDHYHEIRTFMVPISLYDILEFELSDNNQIELWCDDPTLTAGQDNLILKAANLLKSYSKCNSGVRIRLYKRIPWQAGLGGGSSNAAATLLGLNKFWRLGLKKNTLHEFASQLGSDINFFLEESPAWCSGRGEQVVKTTISVPYFCLIIKPDFGLSTAKVYSHLSLTDHKHINKETPRAFGDLKTFLRNDLEKPACLLEPALKGIFKGLKNSGSELMLLSGSGSAVFSLHSSKQDALNCAHNLLETETSGCIQKVFFAGPDTTCSFQ